MTVFDLFKTTPYTFLEIRESETGNKIVNETNAGGVFKLRRGVTQGQDIQNATSTTTLHIRPSEGFVSSLATLEGHGVRVNGNTYRIIGYTDGTNFDNNVLEHITLTLQVEALVS